MAVESNGEVCGKSDITRLPAGFIPDRIQSKAYGLALDIGTTPVIGVLCDLKTGRPVAATARANPQSVFGADVISRIHYASQSLESLKNMQQKIVGCVNEIIAALSHGISQKDISDVAVVGNPAMNHLFLGIDASALARSPFMPVFTSAKTLTSAELCLNVNPSGKVYMLPNIAGHVGADLTGVMLASSLPFLPGASLVVDIGTNGEALLSKDGKIVACSTAAGPAFEGASIHQGMRAAAGAIEGVDLSGGQVSLRVIGGGAPVGICGSGLLDVIAQLLEMGLINHKGRFYDADTALDNGVAQTLARRLYKDAHGGGFVLYEGGRSGQIILTQQDIRSVQLAKGAIAAGAKLMMNHLGVTAGSLDRVMISGAFGSFIKPESALRIGLLPPVPPEKVAAIGNAAGAGACMALLSAKQREIAEGYAPKVEHIELATHPDFINEHMKAMYFPT